MKLRPLSFTVLLVGLFVGSLQADEPPQSTASDKAANNAGIAPIKHMIDTHIHFYDPRLDIPMTWPPTDDKVLYKPHLPKEYGPIAKASGVTGVVIVEANATVRANYWMLDLVKADPFYVGLVGRVDMPQDSFGETLAAIAKDKRLVGIRPRVLAEGSFTDPAVLENLRELARQNLTMDYLTNSGGIEGLKVIETVAREVPELTIVVNHCLGYDFDGKPASKQWVRAVKRLAKNKNVYCKISGLYQRSVPQPAPQDIKHFKPVLEVLWDQFGSERLIYGSNWPVTKRTDDYASFVRLVDQFISPKGQQARENYYWKNAATAYRLPLQ